MLIYVRLAMYGSLTFLFIMVILKGINTTDHIKEAVRPAEFNRIK